MKNRLSPYFLNSILVNCLGVLLFTGMHIWNFGIWLITPVLFYWIAILLSSERPEVRSVATSAKIGALLVLGHLLAVGVAFIATAGLGQPLSALVTGGVEMMEMYFTNSANSFLFGAGPAFVGSTALMFFYFSRNLPRP